MLQRSSLPTASTAEIADSLQRTLDGSLGASLAEPFAGRRWQGLQDALPLPTTWQQYLLACLAITIVVGGMCLHVLLAVDIARAELNLRQLRSDYARVERQNSDLIYAIAQQSSLAQMAKLAAQNGYVPATNRTFVFTDSDVPMLSGRTSAAHSEPSPVTTLQPREAADWLQQTRHWWQDFQGSIGTATGQLWRDFTGRME
jgi:hypothetical protein